MSGRAFVIDIRQLDTVHSVTVVPDEAKGFQGFYGGYGTTKTVEVVFKLDGMEVEEFSSRLQAAFNTYVPYGYEEAVEKLKAKLLETQELVRMADARIQRADAKIQQLEGEVRSNRNAKQVLDALDMIARATAASDMAPLRNNIRNVLQQWLADMPPSMRPFGMKERLQPLEAAIVTTVALLIARGYQVLQVGEEPAQEAPVITDDSSLF